MRRLNRIGTSLVLLLCAGSGTAAAVIAQAPDTGQAVVARARQRAPFKIVLTGDSTVALEGGWGPGFCALLTANVTCVDLAKNGRSTKSFIDEGLWQKALEEHGQYVFFQFGHNDQKPAPALHADAGGAYTDNLRRFIRDVRAAGGVPVVVTPLSRRNYRDDELITDDGLGEYAAAAQRVAAEEGAIVVDLLRLSRALLQGMTQADADAFDAVAHADAKAENHSAVATATAPDRTHLNDRGKAVFGRMVADAVVEVRPELRSDLRPDLQRDPQSAHAAAPLPRDIGPAMAATVRQQWPSGAIASQPRPGAWTYEEGVLLDGMAAMGEATHNPADTVADLAYVKVAVDRWIAPDGSIQTEPGKPFQPALHTLDNLEPGRAVLFLYQQTHDERYRKAAAYLSARLGEQPRNAEGGYWHKEVYPNQMWLDGTYMAEPFRAAYAKEFGVRGEFDDIAKQFLLMEDHMRTPGAVRGELLRHGWDGNRKEAWADKETGVSKEVWARALGWYLMALVDTLPSFPEGHPQRAKLIAVLQRVADGVAASQDADTGVWWDVLDKPGQPGNFREASASAMFVYALLKGVRLGYLPASLRENAMRGWNGLQQQFITGADDHVTLHGTVKVSGLGGKPYRAGDYSYYVHEAVVDDDAKGVGATLLAASEIERLGRAAGKDVVR